MKRIFASLVFLCALSSSALASEHELSFGLDGGLHLPGFQSQDAAAFALTSFSAGASARYGLSWDLWLELRFSISAYSGKAKGEELFLGRALLGERHFDALTFDTEVALRYDLIGGYAFSLYAEGGAGFLFSQYRNQRLLDAQGRDFGLEFADEGEPAFLVTTGLHVEYRLLDLLLISVGVRFSKALTPGLYSHHLQVPLSVTFPFFL